MQSAVACTRLLSRALLNGIYNRNASGLPSARSDNSQDDNSECDQKQTQQKRNVKRKENALIPRLRLVSGISGIPKNLNMRRLNPYQYGDDSCFVSHHPSGDVLGKLHDVTMIICVI